MFSSPQSVRVEATRPETTSKKINRKARDQENKLFRRAIKNNLTAQVERKQKESAQSIYDRFAPVTRQEKSLQALVDAQANPREVNLTEQAFDRLNQLRLESLYETSSMLALMTDAILRYNGQSSDIERARGILDTYDKSQKATLSELHNLSTMIVEDINKEDEPRSTIIEENPSSDSYRNDFTRRAELVNYESNEEPRSTIIEETKPNRTWEKILTQSSPQGKDKSPTMLRRSSSSISDEIDPRTPMLAKDLEEKINQLMEENSERISSKKPYKDLSKPTSEVRQIVLRTKDLSNRTTRMLEKLKAFKIRIATGSYNKPNRVNSILTFDSFDDVDSIEENLTSQIKDSEEMLSTLFDDGSQNNTQREYLTKSDVIDGDRKEGQGISEPLGLDAKNNPINNLLSDRQIRELKTPDQIELFNSGLIAWDSGNQSKPLAFQLLAIAGILFRKGIIDESVVRKIREATLFG